MVDRVQTAGPGTLNVPTEKIYELGNYNSLATIRDIPDLSFSLDSLDVSCEIESMLLGLDFTALTAGQELDMSKVLPLDVASEFKRGKTDALPFNVQASVALPYLYPESIAYKFGVKDKASQTITLKGDSIFYAEASAYIEEFVGTGVAAQNVVFAHTALPYNGDVVAGTRWALAVCLAKSGKRLTPGVDYTETSAGVTITAIVPVTDTIRVTYQSAVVASYPQISNAAVTAIRPAAIRGRDIEIKIGGRTVTDRWSSVQTIAVDWKVTLEKDEEMGNAQAVSQDYDVPMVTGSVDIKPRDSVELLRRIRQVAGVPTDEVVGASNAVPLTLEVLLHSPDDGSVLKTLWVPDARFTVPGYTGTVNQKLSVNMPFESDAGSLFVYNGVKAP